MPDPGCDGHLHESQDLDAESGVDFREGLPCDGYFGFHEAHAPSLWMPDPLVGGLSPSPIDYMEAKPKLAPWKEFPCCRAIQATCDSLSRPLEGIFAWLILLTLVCSD